MPPLTLTCGRLSASLDPQRGSAIVDLSIAGPRSFLHPLLRRAAPGESRAAGQGCFPLVPWSNRVPGGRLVWRSETHRLTPDHDDGSALHGLAKARAWRVTDRTPLSATTVFESEDHAGLGWPWAFGATQRFELSPGGLEVDLSVTNRSGGPMPAGLGLHPYFVRGLFAGEEAVEVRAPVSGEYPLDGGVATGPASATGLSGRLSAGGALDAVCDGRTVDACFAGFGGEAEIRYPVSGVTVRLTASEPLGHLVVYAPRDDEPGGTGRPVPFFCVEPVSHANGAFGLEAAGVPGHGLRVLEPGETLSARVTFGVEIGG